MKDNRFLTLAIESSCDETAAAVLSGGRDVLSDVVSSQIEIHEKYGGVVPEIASRHHLTAVNSVIDDALNKAGVTLDDIDLVGVTCGPGLVGSLVIGIAAAKAIAMANCTLKRTATITILASAIPITLLTSNYTCPITR